MDTILPSKPLRYKRLIDYSFKLYRASFTKVIILSLVLSFIVFIPRFISVLIGQDLFLNLPPLSPNRLWIFVIDLFALIFFIGIIWRMHCAANHLSEPLAEDIKVGSKKLFLVVVACFIQSAILLGIWTIIFGFEILLHHHGLLFSKHLPGLILTVAIFSLQLGLILYIAALFVFLIPLIAIENNGILRALERSILLAWNHWYRVATLQITPWLCYLFVLIVIRYVMHVDIHIYFIDHSPHTLRSTLLHFLIFALFIPWVAAVLLVQLNDLELRKHLVPKV